MSRLADVQAVVSGPIRNRRLLLLQFFANPLLFLLFAGWLLLPVGNFWHVAMNAIVAVVLLAAAFVLHAGTLDYFSDPQGPASAPLSPAFRRALRHLAAIAVCAGLFYLLWLLADRFEAYSDSFPSYLRSTFPVFLRRVISQHAVDNLYAVVLFVLRWVLFPGLLLPLALQAAARGIRGLGLSGFSAWRKAVTSSGYWLVLLFAAVLGVFLTQEIMAWTPDFRTSTFRLEAFSLVVRFFVAYVLGLFSWLLACSVVGSRCASGGGSGDIARNSGA